VVLHRRSRAALLPLWLHREKQESRATSLANFRGRLERGVTRDGSPLLVDGRGSEFYPRNSIPGYGIRNSAWIADFVAVVGPNLASSPSTTRLRPIKVTVPA
jgi:hypothetical protein